jgi:hypothetical protein
MIRQIMALYNRRTGAMRLGPVDDAEASSFLN